MTHPADLWKEEQPWPFQTVRARGRPVYHQKRLGEERALCGLLPVDSIHGRWTIYGRLPNGIIKCDDCLKIGGKELRNKEFPAKVIEDWVAAFFAAEDKDQ